MANTLLNYQVLERLGEGAGSIIYKVVDPTTKHVYALKHVVRVDPKDIRFVEQMEEEFAVSKQFTHKGLRRCYDLKINRSMLMKVAEAFLVMELFEGRPLDSRPLTSFPDIIDTFIQTAEALRALHAMGYVHCDLKPNNILRNDAGVVKVIDFGQTVTIGTVKERIQGTPDYIAPEQVNRRPISVQTDVYNLGATIYWALTNRNIPTLYTVNRKGENSFLVHAAIPTPIELNPKVPLGLSNLVMEMVATQMQKRPADMDQVITRLELARHVMQKTLTPPPPNTDEPPAPSTSASK